MKHSLFLRSELIFWRHLSTVGQHNGFISIETPSNPSWHWGHLLALDAPPVSTDADLWTERFDTLISQPTYKHRLLTWIDAPISTEHIAPYLERGFELSLGAVLALRTLKPPTHYNSDIRIETIDLADPRWDELATLTFLAFSPSPTDYGYRTYTDRRIANQRIMLSKGIGLWYIASIGDVVVGSMGIFADHDEKILRFQEVAVHSNFRNQGICTTMVYEIARRARETYPDYTQVIVADPTEDAIRVYNAVGFDPAEVSYALSEKGARRVIAS